MADALVPARRRRPRARLRARRGAVVAGARPPRRGDRPPAGRDPRPLARRARPPAARPRRRLDRRAHDRRPRGGAAGRPRRRSRSRPASASRRCSRGARWRSSRTTPASAIPARGATSRAWPAPPATRRSPARPTASSPSSCEAKGDHGAALVRARQTRDEAERLALPWLVTWSHFISGIVLMDGEPAAARRWLEQSLAAGARDRQPPHGALHACARSGWRRRWRATTTPPSST